MKCPFRFSNAELAQDCIKDDCAWWLNVQEGDDAGMCSVKSFAWDIQVIRDEMDTEKALEKIDESNKT